MKPKKSNKFEVPFERRSNETLQKQIELLSSKTAPKINNSNIIIKLPYNKEYISKETFQVHLSAMIQNAYIPQLISIIPTKKKH